MRKLSRKPSKELKEYNSLYETISQLRTEALAKLPKKTVEPPSPPPVEKPTVADKKPTTENSEAPETNGDAKEPSSGSNDVEMNEESESKGLEIDEEKAKEPVQAAD